MNHMKEIAQLLGVEIGEEFKIEGHPDYRRYKLTEEHLMYTSDDEWHALPATITYLLNGKCKVVKIPKPVLDDVEKEYLSTVIKPFRNRIKYFYKYPCGTNGNYEAITVKIETYGHCDCLDFPKFKKGSMYKNMKAGKEYSLEELGL